MFKNKNISLVKVFFYGLFASSLISILFVAIFSIISDYKTLKTNSENTFKHFNEQAKNDLQSSTEILHSVLLTNYRHIISTFDSFAKEHLAILKTKTNEEFQEIYANMPREQAIDEFSKQIKAKDRLGQHSIYHLDATPILDPFGFKESNIQDFIVNPKQMSAQQYTMQDGQTKVLSYAVVIEEAKILVLYSYNMTDLQKHFKNSMSETISKIKTNKSEYIYIFDKLSQNILFSNFDNNPNLQKAKFYSETIAKDSHNILSIANSTRHSGFLHEKYIHDKEDGHEEECEVVAYIKDIPELNLAVSIGLFTDELTRKIEAEQKILKDDFLNKILAYILYLLFILSLIFVINSFFKSIFDNTFAKFLEFFSRGHNKNTLIPVNEVVFEEFKALADNMNQTIEAKNQKEREKNENTMFLNQYKNAVDISSVLSKTDKNGVITFANDAFCKTSGFEPEELIGNTHKLIKHPDSSPILHRDVWDHIKQNQMWQGVFKNLSKNKEEFYIKTTIIPILDTNGDIKEYIGIGHDITDVINQSKKIEANLQDPLTKLPSRSALVDEINKRVEDCIVASFDISKFKHINEYYGFSVGDSLLVEIAHRLERLITNKNLGLYKLTSDNFALLAKKDQWTTQRLSMFCFEMIDYFRQNPIYMNDDKFEIELVFGISDETCFFITSEMAKDYAKANQSYVVNFSDKKDILMKNVHTTQALKKAIDEDRITVFKQAIIDNKTKQISKYECLVRMIDEEGKIVSPFFFLDIAKSAKLYPKLTKIIIEKSFKYFAKNNDKFSLNFSIEDILSPNIINFLKEKLREYPQIADRLVLEIVEDEGIENFDEITSFIKEIKQMGVGIAIDDFGSGYSNFEYLVKLKADTVKIDGSLIKNIDKNPEMLDVVRLIVEFAKRTDLKTIAEFVSSKDIADIVDGLGINSSQGFYYAEPKPLES